MPTRSRKTKETDITASLDVYGKGVAQISTGVGYFDHMLESFARHALMDISLQCKGDLHVDSHHTVEDCGIVLGMLFADSVYPIAQIERFGEAHVVMDEACVQAVLDVCNRPFFVWEIPPLSGELGTFDCELAEEFFKAFAFNARICLHVVHKRGHNRHHIIEAAFKSCALALRRALAQNARVQIPSTKGLL